MVLVARDTVAPGRMRRAGIVAIALALLSGCNAGSTLPSQNVGAFLTPVESADGVVKNSTTLAAADPGTSGLAPAVKNKLVATSSSSSPAANAAAGVTSAPTAPQAEAKPDVRVPPADIAKLTPKAEKKPELDIKKTDEKPAQAEAVQVAAAPQVVKPQTSTGGFFASFLNNSQAKTKSQAISAEARRKRAAARAKARRLAAARASSGASTKTASTVSVIQSKRTNRVRRTAGHSDLPGVKLKQLFGIESEQAEELDNPIRVASVANLARRGTHGLLLQHDGVKVGCFPPQLVRILKQVERRFGRTPIVTSGYRSKRHNRRIRGARNSMHIYCKAADVQVKGVSKWRLAKYLRSIPGRGGVGTYCHTKSVHIDIAKKRDWNLRCRKRRRR